jgi:hypothetical protein
MKGFYSAANLAFILIFLVSPAFAGSDLNFKATMYITRTKIDKVHYTGSDGIKREIKTKKHVFNDSGTINFHLNSEKSKLTIICNDSTKASILGVDAGSVSLDNICPGVSDPKVGPDLERFRYGGTDRNIPYVISPRYSMLRDPRPTLRWNAVPKTQRYSVELFNDRSSKVICKISNTTGVINRNIVSVPFDGCNDENSYPYILKPGNFYRLRIIAHTPSGDISSEKDYIDCNEYRSEARNVSGIEFRILNNQKENELAKLLEKNNVDSVDPEEKLFVTTSLYDSYSLYSEAILELENSIEANPSIPDNFIKLGDYYASSGLIDLALLSYERADDAIKNLNSDLKAIYSKIIQENRRRISKLTQVSTTTCYYMQ